MKNVINQIGEELVGCNYKCEGIINEPVKGIIPRGLILENEGRNGEKGVIVVGLNPGKSNKKGTNEKKLYLDNYCTYESTLKYWRTVKNVVYFKRIRELIDLFGFDGPIIWTELVKCECKEGVRTIPIQTLRTCFNKYLKKEIKKYPNYTIIANGRESFRFCALSFPNNFIIGVPHSSGSYGDFVNLLKDVKKNTNKYMNIISKNKDKNNMIKALFLKKLK